MNMQTDYTRGARAFTAFTEEGATEYRIVDCLDAPALGGAFLLITQGETDEEGLVEVRAVKCGGTQGRMEAIATTEEWRVIDDMMLQAYARGQQLHLVTDDMEYFQVRARRHGYDSAEQWLLAAIFGECSGEDMQEP